MRASYPCARVIYSSRSLSISGLIRRALSDQVEMGDTTYDSYVAASTSTCRSVIAAELRRLHVQDAAEKQQEAARREAQRDRTRSLVRLMQLDTRDEAKIALHAGARSSVEVFKSRRRC